MDRQGMFVFSVILLFSLSLVAGCTEQAGEATFKIISNRACTPYEETSCNGKTLITSSRGASCKLSNATQECAEYCASFKGRAKCISEKEWQELGNERDTAPPGAVSELKVSQILAGSNSKKNANIIWNNPGDEDFAFVEITIDSDGVLRVEDSSYSAPNLDPSAHKISVVSVDRFGNRGEPVVLDFNLADEEDDGEPEVSTAAPSTPPAPSADDGAGVNVPDTTPPGSVTGLAVDSKGTDWIKWKWTNPTDSDFKNLEITVSGKAAVTTSGTTYTATGLSSSTSYTITVKTVDNVGNKNTGTSSTASTNAPATTTKPACSDGSDNDKDGLTDYPFDCGCSSATDTNEANTAVCPVLCSGACTSTDTTKCGGKTVTCKSCTTKSCLTTTTSYCVIWPTSTCGTSSCYKTTRKIDPSLWQGIADKCGLSTTTTKIDIKDFLKPTTTSTTLEYVPVQNTVILK